MLHAAERNVRLTPPSSFFWKEMFGGLLFLKAQPNPLELFLQTMQHTAWQVAHDMWGTTCNMHHTITRKCSARQGVQPGMMSHTAWHPLIGSGLLYDTRADHRLCSRARPCAQSTTIGIGMRKSSPRPERLCARLRSASARLRTERRCVRYGGIAAAPRCAALRCTALLCIVLDWGTSLSVCAIEMLS